MNPGLKRLLKEYRPLYQRGLLMDGLYRWPSGEASDDQSKPESRPRRRMLLVALTGWRQIMLRDRSES